MELAKVRRAADFDVAFSDTPLVAFSDTPLLTGSKARGWCTISVLPGREVRLRLSGTVASVRVGRDETRHLALALDPATMDRVVELDERILDVARAGAAGWFDRHLTAEAVDDMYRGVARVDRRHGRVASFWIDLGDGGKRREGDLVRPPLEVAAFSFELAGLRFYPNSFGPIWTVKRADDEKKKVGGYVFDDDGQTVAKRKGDEEVRGGGGGGEDDDDDGGPSPPTVEEIARDLAARLASERARLEERMKALDVAADAIARPRDAVASTSKRRAAALDAAWELVGEN